MSTIKITKSVLLISSILALLFFWLSVNFLQVAVSEKEDGQYINKHIKGDVVFRKATIALAEERAVSYWISSLEGLDFATPSLVFPQSATDDALAAVRQELGSVLSQPKYSENLRFQREKIVDLSDDLNAQIRILLRLRDTLKNQIDLPLNQRDQNLRLQILQSYQSVIEKIELLRVGRTYVSRNKSRETQYLVDISESTWNIHIANHHLATLYEEYLTTGETAYSGIQFDVRTLNREIGENAKHIREIGAYANADHVIHKIAIDLADWYDEHYATPALEIAQAMSTNVPPGYSRYGWSKKASELGKLSNNVLDQADDFFKQQAKYLSNKASVNFIIDCLLVVLCFLMAMAVFWIVRKVHYQATHDDLTGLPNRRMFTALSDQYVTENNRFSVVKIDLTKFKAINDKFGQFSGDKLLELVAKRIKKTIGKSHSVARLGGNEFAVLLKGMDKSQASEVTEHLSETLAHSYMIDGQTMSLNNCIGHASYPEDAAICEELRKAADLALYDAKQIGPGTVTAFKPSIAKVFQERQELEAELILAVERNEFELHYQPQFNLERQLVDGVEALIRWRHPVKGMISPFHFIPIAEECGLLPTIGDWVIREASRQAVQWQRECGLYLRMSVNVSVHQFLHGDLIQTINDTLSRESLAPENFEVEVTESVAMADVDMVVEKLTAIHELGALIALDDFGTGYSSLSYLQDLPLDTLKIDRSFISNLDNNSTNKQTLLLESITAMAKQLELHTVAEGVETDAQLHHVCELGIDTVQGYYYSKPVSAVDIPANVRAIDAQYGLSKAA